MLFNSYTFIFVFLPFAVISYWLIYRIASGRALSIWLIALSLFFYGWWSPRDLALILVSIAFNFALCRFVGHATHEKKIRFAALTFGVSANLGALAYFKYFGFFRDIAESGWQSILHRPVTAMALPLAISFFTFQQIGYLVDTYRSRNVGRSLAHYAASVTFFPHLIAGPLVSYRDLYGQFESLKSRSFRLESVALGVSVFLIGLSKKVLLADSFAPIADFVFNNPRAEIVGFSDAWSGSLAYTFQLYFDFSGYSDMAIGLAILFGIRLPANFLSPYKSTSIIEFWRRWHITLSEFLRQYVYISLGGNRQGATRRYINLFVTMLLGGLWHGAGFTFVIWGALHGLYLTINHVFRSSVSWRLPNPIAWALTAVAIIVGWVFFRADTVNTAIKLLRAMFRLEQGRISTLAFQMSYLRENTILVATLITIGGLISIALPNTTQLFAGKKPVLHTEESLSKIPNSQFDEWRWTRTHAVLAAILFVACCVLLARPSTFIYYQF
jgi:alginate O-acetyltransferase complex protein AlgI